MAPCTYDCFDSFSRYWLEEAEKIYPHNKSLKKLRDKIQRAKDGLDEILNDDENAEEDVNGNGAANESDDNVAFWCVFALRLNLFLKINFSFTISDTWNLDSCQHFVVSEL